MILNLAQYTNCLKINYYLNENSRFFTIFTENHFWYILLLKQIDFRIKYIFRLKNASGLKYKFNPRHDIMTAVVCVFFCLFVEILIQHLHGCMCATTASLDSVLNGHRKIWTTQKKNQIIRLYFLFYIQNKNNLNLFMYCSKAKDAPLNKFPAAKLNWNKRMHIHFLSINEFCWKFLSEMMLPLPKWCALIIIFTKNVQNVNSQDTERKKKKRSSD